MLLKSRQLPSTKIVPIRKFDRQLQDLYVRKIAVEQLIRNLEDYQRFQAARFAQPANQLTA